MGKKGSSSPEKKPYLSQNVSWKQGKKDKEYVLNSCVVGKHPQLKEETHFNEDRPYFCVTVFPWMGINKGKR